MRKEVVPVKALPEPTLPLSLAVRFGNLIFVSGIPGLNPQSSGAGDIREQVRFSLDTIKTILEGAGTSLDNVLSVTAYLKHREDFAAYNEVYRSVFGENFPTRATIQSELMRPEMLVEISCIAAIPD